MPPRKIIYPIFLPHAGCPFKCVYCNQNAVVGAVPAVDVPEKDRTGAGGPSEETAVSAIRLHAEQAHSSGRAGEVAFYGGTFTALPRETLVKILDCAAAFAAAGLFTGIRFSTRPDCLDEEICGLLSAYPVSTVELGVQSLSDAVLDASGRGYSAAQVPDAAARVREHGWSLGIQLMAGLPQDSRDRFLDSVARAISIGPDFVRIYPTLVLKDTRLARSFRDGSYRPLALEEAVEWAACAYGLLMSAGIAVARMGLHADPALDLPGAVLAGPHHPAFGYLVRCRWWRDRIDREIESTGGAGSKSMVLRAASAMVSDVVGHRRSNIAYLQSRWGLDSVRVLGDPSLAGTRFVIGFQ
jgi:histone acetyltransferase (RNA polymerase elongator complex component)